MGHNSTTHQLITIKDKHFVTLQYLTFYDLLEVHSLQPMHPETLPHSGALHSSPRYPQSNSKMEATVKSMKKILAASWDHIHLNEDKMCCAILQYCNAPHVKMIPSQPKNCSGTLYKTPYQHITDHFHRNGKKIHSRHWMTINQNISSIVQNSCPSALWHSCWFPFCLAKPTNKDMGRIWNSCVSDGSNRRYFFKTQSGKILVRNHRFIRHQTPASL